MALFRDLLAPGRRRSSAALVALVLTGSACASLEPLPNAAGAPESVAFDDGAADAAPATDEASAPDASDETADVAAPAAEPAADAAAEGQESPDGVEVVAPPIDTSGISLAGLLPTASVLGPNWVGNAEIAYSIPEVLSGDGDCAVGFRNVADEIVEAGEALSESTGTIVVNSVAARLESAAAGQALVDRIAVRDAVTCDGDPNAIVYLEPRGDADVAFSWSIDVAGEQGPLETGVVLVRRGDVMMVGSVVAEAGVHDIESILWKIVDHAIVGIGA